LQTEERHFETQTKGTQLSAWGAEMHLILPNTYKDFQQEKHTLLFTCQNRGLSRKQHNRK